MKFTKTDILSKHFHIVEENLEVLDPSTWNEFLKITTESAVMIGNEVFCTKIWHQNLMEKMEKENVS